MSSKSDGMLFVYDKQPWFNLSNACCHRAVCCCANICARMAHYVSRYVERCSTHLLLWHSPTRVAAVILIICGRPLSILAMPLPEPQRTCSPLQTKSGLRGHHRRGHGHRDGRLQYPNTCHANRVRLLCGAHREVGLGR
jgi:hypothetical protein